MTVGNYSRITGGAIINVMALKNDIMVFPYLLYFLIYLYLLKWGVLGVLTSA